MLSRPDTSRLSPDEMHRAVKVPKRIVDPISRVRQESPRVEYSVDVFHDRDPVLSLKGVQLKLIFTKNPGAQLRHRFLDEARNQIILLFHSEDNHKTLDTNERIPHIHFAPATAHRRRLEWKVPRLLTFDDSVREVLSYLNITDRNLSLESFSVASPQKL